MPLTEVKSIQDLKNSPAAKSLLQLFFSTEEDFDFKRPFLPPPFVLKTDYAFDCFECLRSGSGPIPSSSAFMAVRKPPLLPVVVKFNKKEAIDKEVSGSTCRLLARLFLTIMVWSQVSILKLLSRHDISSTPRLLCFGMVPGIGNCLVIRPVGALIGVNDIPPARIAQVALDVVTTIIHLNTIGILHCDVSAGNVLVTVDGRGLLVDYGSSLQGKNIGSHRVTGQPRLLECPAFFCSFCVFGCYP